MEIVFSVPFFDIITHHLKNYSNREGVYAVEYTVRTKIEIKRLITLRLHQLPLWEILDAPCEVLS